MSRVWYKYLPTYLATQPRQDDNAIESLPLYLDVDSYNKVKILLYKKKVDKDILDLANKIATSEPWCKNCFNLEGPSPTEDEINAAARLLNLYVDRYSEDRTDTMSMLRKTKQEGTGDMGSEPEYDSQVLSLVFVALGARSMLEAPPRTLQDDKEVMILLKEAGVVAISTAGLGFAASDEKDGNLSMVFVRQGDRAWRRTLEKMDSEKGSEVYHTQFGSLVGYTVENIVWYVSAHLQKPKEECAALARSEMAKLQDKLRIQDS